MVEVVNMGIRAASRAEFVRQVGTAFEQTGFVRLTGHSVDPKLVARTYAATRAYFAQDMAEKMRHSGAAVQGHVGFTPPRGEQAVGAKRPDEKEFFHYRDPDHPAWKKIGCVRPPLQEVAEPLREAMEGTAEVLLTACAEHLGEHPRRLANMVRGGETVLRFLHYPPQSVGAGERAAPHGDINFVTLLPPATAKGLEIWPRGSNRWVPVELGENEMVVNVGDMMEHLTNRRLPSTVHRVVTHDPSIPRYSVACFVHPRNECSLAPLPSCGVPQNGALTAGAFLQQRLDAIMTRCARDV